MTTRVSFTNQIDAVAIGLIKYADVERHLLSERQQHGLSYPEFIDALPAEVNPLRPRSGKLLSYFVPEQLREPNFAFEHLFNQEVRI
jgi:hypothetical protein